MELNSESGVPVFSLPSLSSCPPVRQTSGGRGRVLCGRLYAVFCGLRRVQRTYCSNGGSTHSSWILIRVSGQRNIEHGPGQCGFCALRAHAR